MFRKIMWCYVFVLTLLDISLNTKLSAQGKSHGVTVHDSLIEGITFQEWGKDAGAEGGRGGRAVAAEALALAPPALAFGRRPLAAAHVLAVTLTNTANTTMHLASVAGTTPDFHASFFESKTLAPQANTSFSVVYLGRREGPVSAHLYIHTSLGVHKYPVSAVGVASEWGVWPLVGVRVPLNASVEPLLTMHNPTHHTIQVSEVYSSGAWVGLRLPGGGEAAPRGAWTLPPHSARALVRLRLRPHSAHQQQRQHDQPLTAYIRIKANMTGGGLVVGVEAVPTQPGEYLSPLQIRISARGSRDPPDMVELEAGNSLGAGVQLDAQVWGARCGPQPLAPPPPPPEHERAHLSNGQAERERERGTLNGFAGARADGVHVTLERAALGAHQSPTRVARLTIDHARLWAGRGAPSPDAPAPADEAWCAGWVRVGRAAAPFSLKLVPGTLALHPPALHFVTGAEEAPAPLDVYARNEFATPVYVSRVRCPPAVEEHFRLEWATPLVVAGGGRARLGRLEPRRPRADLVLDANLTVVTNVTEYALPLMVYSGKLAFEWEWPRWSREHLNLGAVGTSSTRRVGVRLVNGGPAPLCVRELRAQLPGAQLALAACAHLRPPPAEHACRCVGGGRAARAWLTVVAPAREGPLQGTALVATEHAAASATVTLHAHKGRVHAHPLLLYRAAPYARSSAPLVLESSMALKMRLANVTQPETELDPALSFLAHEEEASPEVGPGRRSVGRVLYAPERACAPHCYAGLDAAHPDGEQWLRRAAEPDDAALAEDTTLHAHRHALYRRHPHATNVSLHVHTTQVVQIPVSGVVQWWWPRLAEDAAGVGDAGLAAVGAAVRLPLRVRNPSPTHRLLLQPVISERKHILAGEPEAPSCGGDECLWAESAFRLGEWRATRGAAAVWGAPRNGTGRAMSVLLLEPDAEVELTLTFAPEAPAALAAHLYLRNNLTIIESVVLRGRGAHPSFELGGRKPGAAAPLVFEVSECDGGGEAPATVVRTVIARNTGAVPVRLRDWRVAGQPCWARGFSVQPCAPLALAPNESRPLRLAFTADFTLARVPARLHVRADGHRAEFALLGAAPARLLARCHARAPPPPFEPPLRAAATLLAVAALALAIAAAALDAERELRRARAARPASPARPPLDLRAVAAHPPQPPLAPAPAGTRPRAVAKRRRPAPRRPVPAPDPHAERRAFDRWRSEVLRAPDDDDDRSSEDADDAAPDRRPPSDPETRDAGDERPGTNDGYEADPENEERPTASGDEDAASTGSASGSSSTPADEREDDEDDDAEDCDEPENLPLVANGEPRDVGRGAEPALRFDTAATPAAEEPSRAGKVRREADAPRRSERARPGEGGDAAAAAAARGRHASAKHHARKEKTSKRRAERPPPSPPRGSPPRAGEGRAPGAVRWGASWSSVVAARGGRRGGRGRPRAHRVGRAPARRGGGARAAPRRRQLAVLLQRRAARAAAARRGVRVARHRHRARRVRPLHAAEPRLPRRRRRGGRRRRRGVPRRGRRVGRLGRVGRGAPAARLRRARGARARLRPLPLARLHLGAGRARLAPGRAPPPARRRRRLGALHLYLTCNVLCATRVNCDP